MATDITIDPQALRFIPENMASVYDVLPLAVSRDGSKLLVAGSASESHMDDLANFLGLKITQVSTLDAYKKETAIKDRWEKLPSDKDVEIILRNVPDARGRVYPLYEEEPSIVTPFLDEDFSPQFGKQVIDTKAFSVIPENLAAAYNVVPLAVSPDGKQLLVAATKEHQDAISNDLANFLGMKIIPVTNAREYAAATREAGAWGDLPNGKDAVRILDNVAAARQELYTGEIAPRTGIWHGR